MAVCEMHKELFQSLIGRLKTGANEEDRHRLASVFQSLIGRLKT